MTWAELMLRVFKVDVLECPRCKGRLEIVATVTTPPIIDFGGTLALGPAITYFPRTQAGGPMLHSHGMVYERPQLTVWWTDFDLPENVFEFAAAQAPGSTLTALTQFAVPAGGIEDITFDPNDQSLWYIDEVGIVRHINVRAESVGKRLVHSRRHHADLGTCDLRGRGEAHGSDSSA